MSVNNFIDAPAAICYTSTGIIHRTGFCFPSRSNEVVSVPSRVIVNIPCSLVCHSMIAPLAHVEKTRMTSDGTPHLLLAILTRAIRDLRHEDPLIRAAARQWLWEDPLCAEICEILGYTLPALHRATGLASPRP